MKTSAFALYIRRASPEVQHANLFIFTDAICAKAPSGGFMVYQVQMPTWDCQPELFSLIGHDFYKHRFDSTIKPEGWSVGSVGSVAVLSSLARKVARRPQSLGQVGPGGGIGDGRSDLIWAHSIHNNIHMLDTQTQSDTVRPNDNSRSLPPNFNLTFRPGRVHRGATKSNLSAPGVKDRRRKKTAWARVSFVRSLSEAMFEAEAMQGKAKLQRSRSSNPRNVPGSAGFVTRGCLRRHAGCSTRWSGSGVGPGVSDSVSSEFILSTFNLFLSSMKLSKMKSTESIGFVCRQTWWDPGWIRQDICRLRTLGHFNATALACHCAKSSYMNVLNVLIASDRIGSIQAPSIGYCFFLLPKRWRPQWLIKRSWIRMDKGWQKNWKNSQLQSISKRYDSVWL